MSEIYSTPYPAADKSMVFRSAGNKQAALIAAAAYCAHSDTLSSKDVMDIADKFLTWLEGT